MLDDISPWMLVVAVAVIAVTLFVVVKVLMRLYGLRRRVHSADAPTSAKVSYYAAWLYALSPVDLLPDPILIDDIGVILTAIALIERQVRTRRTKAVHTG